MNKTIYSAVLLLSAALPAFAAGPQLVLDFDGAKSSQGLNAAANDGLISFIREAKLSDLPLKTWPPLPDPECNVGPDGNPCGGGGPQPGDEPGTNPPPDPVPHPNPGPNPHPPQIPVTPPIQPHPGPGPTVPPQDLTNNHLLAGACIVLTQDLPGCIQGTPKDALDKMKATLRKTILEDSVKAGIVLVFPPAASVVAIYELLQPFTEQSVVQLTLDMQEDLALKMKEMEANDWGTPVAKARMMRVIVKDEELIKIWKAAALLEAQTGKNWSKTGKNSYEFMGGPAYQQLREGLEGKEIFTGQARKRLKGIVR